MTTLNCAPAYFLEPWLTGTGSLASPIVAPERNVTMFHSGLTIGSHTVLHIDNRGEPRMHQAMIQREWDAVNALAADVPVPAHLPAAFRHDTAIRALVERGLVDGSFIDTTRIARWLGIVNSAGLLAACGLGQLQLVHVFAERDIDEVMRQVMTDGMRPAGMTWSGSPKMLSVVKDTDPAVGKSLELMRFGLAHEIPMLGLCWGMQAMADTRFGAMVEWMKTPPDARLKIVSRDPLVTLSVPADHQHGVYGMGRMQATTDNDLLLRGTKEAVIMQAHSQHLPVGHPNIPPEAVLATSERWFADEAGAETVRRTIELLQCGPVAYGAEGHPEMSPDLFAIFAHVSGFRALMEREGQDLIHLAADLDYYRHLSDRSLLAPLWAGEGIGYHFMRHVLLPDYLAGEAREHPFAAERQHAAQLLGQLRDEIPGIHVRRFG